MTSVFGRPHPEPRMTREEMAQHASRWQIYSYLIAVVGSVGIPAAAIPARALVQPATVALVLVLVVLMSAMLGGRGPAWAAAILGFLAFDLFHTTPYYRFHMDQIEELEIALVFIAIAAIAGEIAVQALEAREAVLRAEFRQARLGRVLGAASSGVGRAQLTRMIEHELVDELQLDTVRYEPEPRTSTRYRIDDRGQLLDRNDIPSSRLRLPNEPVAIEVTTGGRDLGQLVLIPECERPVTDDQLFLAANLAALLAGLIHEAQD